MHTLNVIIRGAILFGLLAVGLRAWAQEKPFVGKLKTETAPDEKPASSRSVRPQESPSATDSDQSESRNKPLADVVVEGNQTIPTEEILKLVKMRPGMPFDPQQVKADVQALVSTRWFFDVETRILDSENGPVLVIRFKERPILRRVTYVGNQKFNDEYLATLIERIGLKPGKGFWVEHNQTAVRDLLAGYHVMGHAFADVKLEKGDSPDDREVVFKIDEGPRVVVTKISVSGNKALPDWVLRLHAKTSTQTAWFSDCLFIRSDVHDDAFELKRLYKDRGFADVQVETRETFSKDQSEVQIEFAINEGIRYRIRNIEFVGNEAISDLELRERMKVRTNDHWNARLVQIDCEKIEDQCRQLGAFNPQVSAREKHVDGQPGIIDLIYEIREGFHENAEWVDDEPTAAIQAGAERLLGAESSSPVLAELQRLKRKSDDSRAQSNDSKSPNSVGRSLPASAISRVDPIAPRETVEPPGLRDFNQMVFIGVETFDASEIRHRLAVDFDLIVAAHPDASLFDYLKAIEVPIANGYRHGGFLAPEIDVLYSSTRDRVEVRVREGHRCRCGEVQVSGAGSLAADQLIRAMTTENAASSRGRWEIGGPVPFDDATMLAMQSRLKHAFLDAGFFEPVFEMNIYRDPDGDGQTAGLLVTIMDEGPCSTVRRIEVVGTKRDSAADVQKFLDIAAGTPCTRELLDRIEHRLLESGRYLRVAVTTESALGEVDGRKPRDVTIQLREYAEAAPIAQELPPAEQALLKLGEWAKRWARGETGDDVVITATSATDGAQAANKSPKVAQAVPHAGLQMALRMVVRPRAGQTITWGVTHKGGEKVLESLFIAGPHEVVFASPLRKAKLVLPISAKDKVTFEFSGTEVPVDQVSEDKRRFRLNLGMNWNTRADGYPNPFEVNSHFTAAFLTSLAHLDDPQCTILDGTIEIRSDTLVLQIDRETGRLIECQVRQVDETDTLTMRTERNAYEAERQSIDGVLTTCAPAYAAESPWKSIVEFVLDEYLQVASRVGTEDRILPYRALRKVIGAWGAPGIGELYGVLDYPINDANPFIIPSPWGGPLSADSTERGSSWRKQMAAGIILPIYRHLVPQRGWMWPAGRDGVLSWAEEAQVPVASFRAAPLSAKTGPLGELCLGWIDTLGGLNLVRKIVSREGLQRLTAEALSNDYWPALTDESWLGRWILSLAEAVRLLDEREIQSLVSLLPDDDLLPREALAKSLVLLTTDRETPVDEVLPKVLDRFWEEGLRGTVKSALTKLAPPRLFQRVPKRQDDAVVPAGFEIEMGVEDDGDEDILILLDQEWRSAEPQRLKSTAIPDQGSFPDGEPSVDDIPEILP